MAKLKSELEVTCPCCQATLVIDTNLGRVDLAPRAGARQQARVERRAADPGATKPRGARASSSSRSSREERAATRCRSGSRRRCKPGEAGADHQADARLRSRLSTRTRSGRHATAGTRSSRSRRVPASGGAIRLAPPPPDDVDGKDHEDECGDEERCFHEERQKRTGLAPHDQLGAERVLGSGFWVLGWLRFEVQNATQNPAP